MGKTAFITGTNRGIGNEIARIMASKGFDIIAHARKRTEDFERMISTMASDAGVSVRAIYFEMTDSEEMKTAIKAFLKKKIQIDVLVNSAGVAKYGVFAMFPVSEIRNVFDVNFFGHLELTQLLLRNMIKNKKGCIINISSIAGIDTDKGNCAYGTSKAALISWTKILASEVAPMGIRVNAVAPGMTNTEMVSLLSHDELEKMISESAMKRMAVPTEIANVVAFLASEEASFVNGAVIRVDGGKFG